eukprot:scaffold5460_cov153-Skeletonema_dohrnii-CCMP3373.AAC.5
MNDYVAFKASNTPNYKLRPFFHKEIVNLQRTPPQSTTAVLDTSCSGFFTYAEADDALKRPVCEEAEAVRSARLGTKSKFSLVL